MLNLLFSRGSTFTGLLAPDPLTAIYTPMQTIINRIFTWNLILSCAKIIF